MGSVPGRDYVDRGVQTDTPCVPDTPTDPLQVTCASLHHSTLPCTAYSHSFLLESPRPSLLMATPRRMPKPLPFSSHRPSELINISSKRIISLPETIPGYAIEMLQLSSKTRVVSMPEPIPSESHTGSPYSDCFETSRSTESSYLSVDNGLGYTRTRAFPRRSDMPHTPSPPSSPESVMIIDNDVQVPRAFLRHHKAASRPPSARPVDDGWIKWASSPPRPIPALHGPLSLPYARCPSGAEGTIIEEPDDLSRMIWGLGDDDNPSAHTRSHSYAAGSMQKRFAQSNVPPRMQRLQAERPSSLTPQMPHQFSDQGLSISMSEYDGRPLTTLVQHTPEHLGSRFPRDQSYDARGTSNRRSSGEHEQSTKRRSTYKPSSESLVDNMRALDLKGGLGLDWQAALAQKSIREQRQPEVLESLQPSANYASTQNLYPRIFVESRSDDHNVPPRRMSAFEIAQQYRNQQQTQAQFSLPTPPSSASPQWSPYFSQEPLYLPDLPALRSSRLQSADNIQPQTPRLPQYNPNDTSQDLRKFVYERIGSTDVPLDAAAHVNSPLEASRRHSPNSSPSNQAQSLYTMSPRQPGPPPNTPLPPVPRRISNANYRLNSQPIPPSPTSPEARGNTLSNQQPRSIPLARLIRRLSSVPELEEESLRSEHKRSPVSPIQQKPSTPGAQSRRTGAYPPSILPPAGMHGRHSARAKGPVRALSPGRPALSPETQIGLRDDDASDAGAPRAPTAGVERPTVRLPGKARAQGHVAAYRAAYGPVEEKDKGGTGEAKAAPKRKNRTKKNKHSGGHAAAAAAAQPAPATDMVPV